MPSTQKQKKQTSKCHLGVKPCAPGGQMVSANLCTNRCDRRQRGSQPGAKSPGHGTWASQPLANMTAQCGVDEHRLGSAQRAHGRAHGTQGASEGGGSAPHHPREFPARCEGAPAFPQAWDLRGFRSKEKLQGIACQGAENRAQPGLRVALTW